MNRSLVLAAAAAATLLTATAANAGGVHWSVGINLPPIATVVSSGPGYYPAPAYVAPTYYPEPAYYSAPAYYPEPVAYYPPRVYAPRPRVWVAPVVRPFYGAPWHGPARVHDRYPHAGQADWRR